MVQKISKRKKAPQKKKQKLENDYRKRGMYTSIRISNFRLFDKLDIENLARVNLFFGPNNSGKSSLLEAIFTHAAGLNFGPFSGHVILKRQNHAVYSHLDFGEKIISLFNNRTEIPFRFSISAKIDSSSKDHILDCVFEPSYEIADLDPRLFGQYIGNSRSDLFISREVIPKEIQVSGASGTMKTAKFQTQYVGKFKIKINEKSEDFNITYPPEFPAHEPFKFGFASDVMSHREPESDIRVFSALKRYGILDEFAEELKNVFEEVHKIDQIPYPDGKYAHVFIETKDKKKLPLFLFGDGMRRWFFLIGHMIVYKDAVHCIEEIDATFHPKSHKELSKNLIRYAEKFNNQLFITSHSIEFADAFLNGLYGKNGIINRNSPDPVRIFTIKKSKERKVEVWNFSGREAFEKRDKFDIELRG